MIIARDKDTVYIAQSLSRLAGENNLRFTKRDTLNQKNINLFKLNGSSTIGGIYSRDGKCYHAYKIIEGVRGKLTIEKMVNNVLPKIQEITEMIGWSPKDNDDRENPFDCFFIARDDTAFRLSLSGSIIEMESDVDYAGGDFYVAQAYEAQTMENTLERIKNAYHVAEIMEFERYFPIAIIDTKSQKIKIYEE
jgi:hypothetical protein